MKQLFYLIVFLTIVLTGRAQTVVLHVHQPDPLQIETGVTEFNI